jgi:glycosyltransferase involved in cell wall biosynthesis
MIIENSSRHNNIRRKYMKIGFFLENKLYNKVDFSRPELGNPGIRGTQYMIWIIACKLAKYHDIYLFARCIDKMPSYLHSCLCKDEKQAFIKAVELGVEVLVLRACNENADLYQSFNNDKVKLILWSHNFENYKLANSVAKNRQIKRFVCVGRQQYERLRDHEIFFKSTYIYNALDFKTFKGKRIKNDNKTVTYIGALNNQKGFHILAKSWKKICKLVPNAQLNVLGTGNMGKNVELGQYGLADKKYEKRFMKYLLDKNGNILSSVHFLGSIGGNEKQEVMLKTSVGVANPSGKSETFCIVATEFEALGIPVVSKKGYGLLDTVVNGKTGILVNNERELISAITRLLTNHNFNNTIGTNGYHFVRKHFSIEKVVQQWLKLIDDVKRNEPLVVVDTYSFSFNQFKWLREINRKIQYNGLNTPSLLMYEYIKTALMNILLKIRSLHK